MRVFCVTSYKGTRYYGWERQVGQITIEEEIEVALSKLFNRDINIYGSGRTDGGVHAYGQTFHFDVSDNKYDKDDLKYRLNQMLPADINIISITYLEDGTDFHSRFSSKSKVYEYRLSINNKNPFRYEYCWMVKTSDFDIDLFDESLEKFIGQHNFQNFTSKEEDQNNFIRQIFEINRTFDVENQEIVVEISGDGFMRYQIRYIIGVALNIAIGKEKLSYIDENLDSEKKRSITSYKAPAQGLYLKEVRYK